MLSKQGMQDLLCPFPADEQYFCNNGKKCNFFIFFVKSLYLLIVRSCLFFYITIKNKETLDFSDDDQSNSDHPPKKRKTGKNR